MRKATVGRELLTNILVEPNIGPARILSKDGIKKPNLNRINFRKYLEKLKCKDKP